MNETDEIGLLSHEVQELLGKKFSWIIRNGNLLLFFALFCFFLIGFIIQIPNYQSIQTKAVKHNNHFEISFQVHEKEIQFLNQNAILQAQTKGLYHKTILIKVESIRKSEMNFYLVNASFESKKDLPNSFEVELIIPTEQKRLIEMLFEKIR